MAISLIELLHARNSSVNRPRAPGDVNDRTSGRELYATTDGVGGGGGVKTIHTRDRRGGGGGGDDDAVVRWTLKVITKPRPSLA